MSHPDSFHLAGEFTLGNFDRFILLASLSIFFIGFASGLINVNLRQKDAPRSVMVSPTAASMVVEDPRPKADKIIKLCYSAEKFISDVRKDKAGAGERLMARGLTDSGEPVEMYVTEKPGGKMAWSVYIWQDTSEKQPEVCRIAHGRGLEILTAQESRDIEPESIPEPVVEPDDVPLPVNPPDYLDGIGETFELQSVPDGGPAVEMLHTESGVTVDETPADAEPAESSSSAE